MPDNYFVISLLQKFKRSANAANSFPEILSHLSSTTMNTLCRGVANTKKCSKERAKQKHRQIKLKINKINRFFDQCKLKLVQKLNIQNKNHKNGQIYFPYQKKSKQVRHGYNQSGRCVAIKIVGWQTEKEKNLAIREVEILKSFMNGSKSRVKHVVELYERLV